MGSLDTVKRLARLLCALILGALVSIGHANAVSASQNAAREDVVLKNDAPIADILALMDQMPPGHQTGEPVAVYHVGVVNGEEDTIIWRLSTEMLRPVSFSIDLTAKGRSETILASRYPYAPQKTRASQGRVLSSWPVVLEPGQRAVITARVDQSTAATVFPIRFRPEAAYDATQTKLSYLHGGYLGGAAIFLAFFIAFSVLLSSPPARFYAIYFGALVVLNFHSYGLTEQLFFPEARWLYFPLFRLLQVGIMLAYLLFAISFLRASTRYRKLFKVTIVYVALTTGLALLETLFWNPFFVFITDAMALAFLALGTFTAYVAVRDRLNGAVFFASGYALLLITGVINYVASFPGFASYNNGVDALTLSLQIADAFVFAAAIVSQTHGLRRDRDRALKAQLSATREKLALSEVLRAAERDRDQAARLAERRRARFAATSHDLRQPLTSLKLALEDAQRTAPEMAAKFSTGLEYLNDILARSLEEARPLEHDDADGPGRSDAAEAVPLQVLLRNIDRMFVDEARSRGVTLRVVPTSVTVHAPAIGIIRMLTNIVSNAIKYAPSGRVLIGVRREGGMARLEVHDTGPGMEDAALQAALKPHRRGNAARGVEGEGLGLAIVQDLARQNRFEFRARSRVGHGTVFAIGRIPLSEPRSMATPAKTPPAHTKKPAPVSPS
ncbi:MAG: sensor histidine kinase [Alphaproteobacteria bacterium]